MVILPYSAIKRIAVQIFFSSQTFFFGIKAMGFYYTSYRKNVTIQYTGRQTAGFFLSGASVAPVIKALYYLKKIAENPLKNY